MKLRRSIFTCTMHELGRIHMGSTEKELIQRINYLVKRFTNIDGMMINPYLSSTPAYNRIVYLHTCTNHKLWKKYFGVPRFKYKGQEGEVCTYIQTLAKLKKVANRTSDNFKKGKGET